MNKRADKERLALIMLLGDASGDPRPRRMIDLLINDGYMVDLAGYNPAQELPVRKNFLIKQDITLFDRRRTQIILYLKRVMSFLYPIGTLNNWLNGMAYRILDLNRELDKFNYDLIVVEDLFLLPIAFKVRNKMKIIFDAREYYPLQNEERFLWRIFEKPDRIRLCRKYLKQCYKVLTVSPGLAERYKLEFNVDSTIYFSVPFKVDRNITNTLKHSIRIVHHGVANANRQLEKMIDVVKMLDERFTFDMYLTGSMEYIEFLKKYSHGIPSVRICNPIPFDQINDVLASNYDIGFFYNEPLTFNLRHSLPNKIFEFIQARLAVAIAPSPDMSEIVKKYNCGVIAPEFTVISMASVLNSLTSNEIDKMKMNADIAAQELNYEKESIKFLKILKSVV